MGVNLIKKNCCNKNITVYKSTDFVVENKNKSILKSSKPKNNNENNENSPKIKSINISQINEQSKKNQYNILSSPHKRRNRKLLNYSVKVSNIVKFDLNSKKNFLTIESNNSAKINSNNNDNNNFKGRNRKRGHTAKELKTISMEELLKKKKKINNKFFNKR